MCYIKFFFSKLKSELLTVVSSVFLSYFRNLIVLFAWAGMEGRTAHYSLV